MVKRCIAMTLLVCLFGAARSALARADDAALLTSPADLKPVTLVVVDGSTGQPLDEFSYRFEYKAPGRVSPKNKIWQPVESPDGTAVIQAPIACRLSIELWTRDFKAGSQRDFEFIIRSNDNPRRVVMQLERGETVRGTVRNAKTRKPIAGATVTPDVSVFIWQVSDEDRHATTDKDGHFELQGVDPKQGVTASHPDYTGEADELTVRRLGESRFDVYLNPAEPIGHRGTVCDSEGKPLEGVTVTFGNETVRTAGDGTFTLHSRAFFTKFSKKNYVTRELDIGELNKNGFVVLMDRQIELKGQVLAPDGSPVERFSILAGPGQSSNDDRYVPSVDRAVQDREGRFTLGLDHQGNTWFSVRAEGFAVWEGWTEVASGDQPRPVRLDLGAPVTAQIVAPRAADTKIKARLIPRRDWRDGRGLGSQDTATNWAALTTTVADDAALKFHHVRADRYTLELSGPDVTPRTLVFDVPAEGIDLGKIELAGRGRIEGQVFRSTKHGGGVWSFADGRVRLLDRSSVDEIDFIADENGRFSVDGVWSGIVKVGVPYMIFDVMYADEWVVQVLEGKTTEVRILDPERSRPLQIEFRLGDGSKAQYESATGLGAKRKVDNVTTRTVMGPHDEEGPRPPQFRVDLIPRPGQSVSFVDPEWAELDGKSQVVLSDASPGAYRLRAIDWLGLTDFQEGILFEREINLPADALPIKVPLGAGCITGRYAAAGRFLDPGVVVAVPRDANSDVRRARCDENGNFCVRYLAPGEYTLFAHDPNAGWSRIENVKVAANVTDVGEHRLTAGGTIRGNISFRRPSPVPDEVVAFSSTTAGLRLSFELNDSLDRFELANLWPGHWTILLCSHQTVLATASAELSGTEKVQLHITAGDDRRP